MSGFHEGKKKELVKKKKKKKVSMIRQNCSAKSNYNQPSNDCIQIIYVFCIPFEGKDQRFEFSQQHFESHFCAKSHGRC